jgi:hypothetical protein
VDLYLRWVFPRFGLPSKIISDRDPRFTSKFMKELFHLIGAKANTSTAYHPRTDGQSERSNQWLGQYLRPWVKYWQNNWEPYLALAEFAHNSWQNETTKQSPFKVLMGYKPKAEIADTPTSLPNLALCRDSWIEARENTTKYMKQAQQRWAQSKKEGRTFKTGDLVWLEGRNLHLDQPSAKLAPKRHGPFPITKVLSPITYQLTLPYQWKIHDVFHVDLLTPYIETEFHGPNHTRPPPDLIDNNEEYEVEQVLNSRRHSRGCKVQYLVKWKGYPNSDNEWVDWDNMHAEDALNDFRRHNPSLPTHKSRSVLTIESPSTTTVIRALMSSNASTLSAALPYADLEGPIPYDGPTIQATHNARFEHQPTKAHRDATWHAAFRGLNCQVPSSWRTPSPSPTPPPSPASELDIRYSFRVQQNLIDPAWILRNTLARGSQAIPLHS